MRRAVENLFPKTTPNQSTENWTINGIGKYVHSKEDLIQAIPTDPYYIEI